MLTKEHVIPQWTFGPAGLKGRRFSHAVGRPRDPRDAKGDIVYGPGRLAKRPTIGGHWAPVACKACNEGWMRDIQNQVKPIALPFIYGQSPVLSWQERYLIARWLGVMVACGEYYVGNPTIPQFERSQLVTGQVYPQWLFSYARSIDTKLNGTIQINNRHSELQTTPPGHLTSAWITIGKTVFHCLAAGAPWDIWYSIGSYPQFQSRFGLRSLWPDMVDKPVGQPGYLSFKRVRQAQDAILRNKYRPSRDFEPDDIRFMF